MQDPKRPWDGESGHNKKWAKNVENEMCGLRDNQDTILAEVRKLAGPSLAEGSGIDKDIAGTAMDLFLKQGVPYLAKKGLEIGRYYASEAMRDPKLQRKAIDWAVEKGKPMFRKVGNTVLDELSTKVRPKIRYKTDRPDLDNPTGAGIPVPFPFVDFKKLWSVISDPKLFKGPEVSEKEGRAMVAEYKRQYKDKGGSRSYRSWIKW